MTGVAEAADTVQIWLFSFRDNSYRQDPAVVARHPILPF